jgi:hypothetical protein
MMLKRKHREKVEMREGEDRDRLGVGEKSLLNGSPVMFLIKLAREKNREKRKHNDIIVERERREREREGGG